MNDQMSDYIESTNNTSSAMMHTVQRHRDILQVMFLMLLCSHCINQRWM